MDSNPSITTGRIDKFKTIQRIETSSQYYQQFTILESYWLDISIGYDSWVINYDPVAFIRLAT